MPRIDDTPSRTQLEKLRGHSEVHNGSLENIFIMSRGVFSVKNRVRQEHKKEHLDDNGERAATEWFQSQGKARRGQ